MRFITDWRVKTSTRVGRGRGGLVDFGKSEKWEVSESAMEVRRRREAEDSS
jgi:hypothetical protein